LTKDDKIIIGIDPGTKIMGYGIISVRQKKIELLELDVVNLDKIKNHPLKLKKIFETTLAIIDKFHPDELAIEAQFFGKNIQSMLKLGRAQGVAIAAALYRTIPIYEYSPRKIKQSICGNGNASKEQVAGMLKSIFSIEKMPKLLDATDGLAVALCHHYQNGALKGENNFKDWSSFLSKNPDRIVR